jgi:hypothetical protein
MLRICNRIINDSLNVSVTKDRNREHIKGIKISSEKPALATHPKT